LAQGFVAMTRADLREGRIHPHTRSCSFQPIGQHGMATFCQLPDGHGRYTLDGFVQRPWQFCRSPNRVPCFHCSIYKLQSRAVNTKVSNWLILQGMGML